MKNWISGRSMNKEAEECRESFSQAKRRRMLLFPDGDSTLCSEEMSTEFLKSNVCAIYVRPKKIRTL